MSDAVAVIAAHPDDEVLGCGGTIARLAREGRAVHVLLMADGETSRTVTAGSVDDVRMTERNSAAVRAAEILGVSSVTQLALPDNRMDGLVLLDIVKQVEAFLNQCRPTMVLTHHGGDVNIDHRVVHDAVITASRPQPDYFVRELLFFEVPSSTEWRPTGSYNVFCPNLYYDISDTLAVKLQALRAYEREMRSFPHPRSFQAVDALAQWRGATAGVSAAEAFVLGRKLI